MNDDQSTNPEPTDPSGKHPGGRPEWKPTKADRDKVAILAGGGMSHEAIALVMRVTRNTLEKHCAHELTAGAYEKRAQVVMAMFKAGSKGNVAAAKAYSVLAPQMMDFGQRPSAPASPADPAAPADQPAPARLPAPPMLGKKEQLKANAVDAEAGSPWDGVLPTGTPRPPLQ